MGENQGKNKPSLSDYVGYISRYVDHIRDLTKQEKINVYGYSWGGTMTLIYSAIHNDKVKYLVLQSANLDFDKDDTVIARGDAKLSNRGV
ncbi:MAG: alpha/beta hydrolase [Thermoproteota archaeon]|nr:alpha/beta hydrolase [Thermoproteota archaeon]